jgi:hypothetical protein
MMKSVKDGSVGAQITKSRIVPNLQWGLAFPPLTLIVRQIKTFKTLRDVQ